MTSRRTGLCCTKPSNQGSRFHSRVSGRRDFVIVAGENFQSIVRDSPYRLAMLPCGLARAFPSHAHHDMHRREGRIHGPPQLWTTRFSASKSYRRTCFTSTRRIEVLAAARTAAQYTCFRSGLACGKHEPGARRPSHPRRIVRPARPHVSNTAVRRGRIGAVRRRAAENRRSRCRKSDDGRS